MPYKRYRSRKTAKISTKLRKAVKQIVSRRLETKYWEDDSSLYNLAPTTSGYVYPLSNQIITGTSGSTRVGNKVYLMHLHLKGYIIPADNPYNMVRCIVARGRGQTLTAGDFPSVVGSTDPWTMTVLADKLYALTYSGATVGQSVPQIMSIDLTLNHPLTWSGSSGACENDDIYVYFVSDSLAGPNPTIYSSIKVSYKDA